MRRSEYLPIDPTVGMTYEEAQRWKMLHEMREMPIFPKKQPEPNRLERIPDEPRQSAWEPKTEE